MSAQKDIKDDKPTLGIIAGGGTLPSKLLHSCDKKQIIPFVVGFDGQTDPAIVKGRYHLWTRLGAAAQVIQTLKAHQIKDIVLIGSVRRPSFDELRPDWKTAQLLTRIGFRAFGDDGLLKALRRELEREGFTIHGVQEFVDDLLASEGIYGNISPSREDWLDIEKAAKLAKLMGNLDVGQGCVVQQGIVLGVEAIEGTDELIRRCGELRRKGGGGVLVKACKPGQDKSLDLPTVGPTTIENAHAAKLSGIVLEAGNALLINPQEATEAANRARLFLAAVTLDKDGTVLSKPR